MLPSYRGLDQAISELSGTLAPPAPFLAMMLPMFTLLVLGFGVGVWGAAGTHWPLRAAGAALVFHALVFPLWLLFP